MTKNRLLYFRKPYIIDVGQAVPKGHPMYDELHKRDMKNMYRYWKKQIMELEKEVFVQ